MLAALANPFQIHYTRSHPFSVSAFYFHQITSSRSSAGTVLYHAVDYAMLDVLNWQRRTEAVRLDQSVRSGIFMLFVLFW